MTFLHRCKMLIGPFVVFFLFVTTDGANAFARFSVGRLFEKQPANKSERCHVYHHKYQMHPNRSDVTFHWFGSCENGYAVGRGMIRFFVASEESSWELVNLSKGKRDGRTVIRRLGISGPHKDTLMFQSHRDGFLCGTGADYDMNGYRIVAYKGNCRGGMQQTSNPLDYLLQALGGPSWQFRLIFKFMFNQDGRNASSTAYCMNQFSTFGFSDSVAIEWCSLNW